MEKRKKLNRVNISVLYNLYGLFSSLCGPFRRFPLCGVMLDCMFPAACTVCRCRCLVMDGFAGCKWRVSFLTSFRYQ